MIDFNSMTPEEVEIELQKMEIDEGIVKGSESVVVNYSVDLSLLDGNFIIKGESSQPATYDWVGLYKNSSVSDEDYIGDCWFWVVNQSSYKTSTKANYGYQARYLIYDYKLKKYRSVARSKPYGEK